MYLNTQIFHTGLIQYKLKRNNINIFSHLPTLAARIAP